MDYINAFWVGGLICALVQILMEKTKMLPEAARINRINIVKNNLLFFIRIIFCKPPKIK